MLTAAVKTKGWKPGIYAIALLLMVCSCNVTPQTPTWKTYTNDRFDFEFPYPSNWKALPAPENADGQAFVSPENPQVEIRGWAGNRLPDWVNPDKNAKKSVNPNFKTAQGIPGTLSVEIGKEMSSMTLSLSKGDVRYYWQGRTPSPEFDKYYAAFSYIAQQYRIR